MYSYLSNICPTLFQLIEGIDNFLFIYNIFYLYLLFNFYDAKIHLFLYYQTFLLLFFVGLTNFNIKYPIEYLKHFMGMGASRGLHPNHESHIPNIQCT